MNQELDISQIEKVILDIIPEDGREYLQSTDPNTYYQYHYGFADGYDHFQQTGFKIKDIVQSLKTEMYDDIRYEKVKEFLCVTASVTKFEQWYKNSTRTPISAMSRINDAIAFWPESIDLQLDKSDIASTVDFEQQYLEYFKDASNNAMMVQEYIGKLDPSEPRTQMIRSLAVFGLIKGINQRVSGNKN